MRYKPGQTIDRYEIVESMGEGAYAEAYKARDTQTGRFVLLKSPNPLIFSDPQVYQRFMREAEIAKGLDYPGVQRGLEFRQDQEHPFVVLEFVEGETLRKRQRELGDHIPIETTTDWMTQIAKSLAYLHSQGVTHRDLKPENVLVGDDGILRVADFGTAMATGARRLTWRGMTDGVGTPDYMSPEQIQGERGDRRSDIYAWGIMAYELLAGNVPYDGDNWMAVMAGHLRDNPKRIRKMRPEVSPQLEAVVLKAMRRYPQNRYQTADDLVADLADLDAVNVAEFDLSPEKPMGGIGAAKTTRQLWLYIALIAGGFFLVLVLVIVFSLVVR